MCDVADRLVNKGISQGIQRGETKLGNLILLLEKDGRIKDITKAAADEAYRQRLYKEFNIE